MNDFVIHVHSHLRMHLKMETFFRSDPNFCQIAHAQKHMEVSFTKKETIQDLGALLPGTYTSGDLHLSHSQPDCLLTWYRPPAPYGIVPTVESDHCEYKFNFIQFQNFK